MACYKSGGCGVYEGMPCNECPASKPEYMRKTILNGEKPVASKTKKEPIKIKVFLNEDGVSCVLTDADQSIEVEFIDSVAIECEARDCTEYDEENDPVDAYINQLCADGFTYVDDENISVTNMLYADEA